MSDLRSQLAPGWSPVNIGVTIILFLIAWPLALAMIAYIVWGRQMNLDFSRPETISAFSGRIGNAFRGLKQGWSQPSDDYQNTTSGPNRGGVPSGYSDSVALDEERDSLRRERTKLDEERRKFDAERAANRQSTTQDS